MFTRQDYMNKVCTHEQYYAQYVNAWVISIVKQAIGEDAVCNSKDKHFNDIPLRRWDSASECIRSYVARKNVEFKEYEKPACSLSDCVCVLKAAARQIKESSK